MKTAPVFFINIGSLRRKMSNTKPPLLMQYAATVLNNEGFSVNLIDSNVDKISVPAVVKSLQGREKSFIVISAQLGRIKYCLQIVSQLKKALKASVIIGAGPCATTLYDKFTSQGSPIDYILRGEYDLDLLKLIKSLLDNPDKSFPQDTEGFHPPCRQPIANISCLDELPVLNHELFKNADKYRNIYPMRLNKKLRWGFIITSRGCPNQCSFCSSEIRVTYGRNYRTRSPENVLKEIRRLISLGVNIIDFIDDNFTCKKEHASNICDMLINEKIEVPWICHARVDEVDEALLKKMKQAGCILIRFGVESGSAKVLKRINKFNGDKDWFGMTKKVLGLTNSIGIDSVVMYILGSPTEDKRDIELTKQLIRETNPTLLQLDFFCLYPDSFEYQQLRGCEDFYLDDSGKRGSRLFNSPGMPPSKIAAIYRGIYFKFYLSPKRLLRFIRGYYKFYLANPQILKAHFKGVFLPFV